LNISFEEQLSVFEVRHSLPEIQQHSPFEDHPRNSAHAPTTASVM